MIIPYHWVSAAVSYVGNYVIFGPDDGGTHWDTCSTLRPGGGTNWPRQHQVINTPATSQPPASHPTASRSCIIYKVRRPHGTLLPSSDESRLYKWRNINPNIVIKIYPWTCNSQILNVAIFPWIAQHGRASVRQETILSVKTVYSNGQDVWPIRHPRPCWLKW